MTALEDKLHSGKSFGLELGSRKVEPHNEVNKRLKNNTHFPRRHYNQQHPFR